uniref:MutL homolog 3 n=1 Tax=Paramormyrops kingsleyae TaxID=1676925 RepID=A0A3B3RDL1_9TELE|nr:DNA mismatch repair protein Mlh3 isoform X1 [Paramormyrops kingsleyae]
MKCLSEEVQAKLRSGIAIVSLQQCVEELVLNSVDAGATCIAVRMDMEACKLQVIDNGSGMERDDMERVGSRYYTSKCTSLEDLENLSFYGFRGEAVASIASLATLVEISSRTKLSVKTFVKVFKEGKGLDVFEAGTTRPSSGTTVVICNFFHNMPVRRKRVDPVLECDRIKRRVEALSLMHPSVSFTLKNDCTGAMVVQLSKARSTYHRFIQIHGLGKAQKLGEVSFPHGQFELNGYIGREGHYNSSLQYLFVNSRLVLKTNIHKLLNSLLKGVCGASRLNGGPGVSSALGSPKQKGGQEQHAIYVINIKCPYSGYDVCLDPAKTLIEFKDWESVLFCVEQGVKSFLTRENLDTELSPEDTQDYFAGNSVNQLLASLGRTVDGVGRTPTAVPCFTGTCYDGKTLESKAVYRRLAHDINGTEQVNMSEQVTDSLNKNISNTDASGGMELESELPMSTTSPVHVQKDSWKDQCSTLITTGRPLLELSGDKERHHSPQIAGRLGSPYSGADQLVCSSNTERVKQCESQIFETERCEKIVYITEQEPSDFCKPSSKTLSENTGLKAQADKANDPCLNKLQLGSLGFITHVIPQTHTEEVPIEQAGLSKFCPPGPISAQHLFPQCPVEDHELTSVMQPSRHSGALTCHAIEQQSRGSAFEVHENVSLATKRKLSFLEDSRHLVISDSGFKGFPLRKHKISKVMPCPKVVLTKQAGSLDRFRRKYGKQSGTQPVSVDIVNDDVEMAPEDRTSHVGNTPIIAGKCLSPAEGQLNDTFKTVITSQEDTLPSLSEDTILKPAPSQSSLAGKLSRLKKHRMGNESSTLNVPLNHVPNAGGRTKDKLEQLYDKEEQPSDVLHPSVDNSVLDANANWLGPSAEKHKDTQDCLKHVYLNAEHVSTAIFSIKENNVLSAEMANEKRLNVPLTEGINPSEDVLQAQGTIKGIKKDVGDTGALDSSDWVEHFDDAVGKLVYINKITGLSKYEAPFVEDTQVPCVSDVTTMAVSVISRNGIEYRCYPFQAELVLPFLPRSRAERVLSSGLDEKDEPQSADSLSSLYSKWENPVFVRPPEVAVDVTTGQAEGLAVKIHNILYPYRFTKDMILSMKVIHQVDKKFLACLINTRDQEDANCRDTEGNLLVLVDQHAAHERVRLESLTADSYEEDPEFQGQKQLRSSNVSPPLEIVVTEEELRLLRSCPQFLRGLGLEMKFVETEEPRVLVGKVPVCFVEREASELRHGRRTVTKDIVEEYIQEQLELLRSAGRVRGTLPLTVLKVLASQACHGAVKFNASLSREECCSLIGSLSTCKLPFQCAHGRPSMVPLADLLHLDPEQQRPPKPNIRKLRLRYQAWKRHGNE